MVARQPSSVQPVDDGLSHEDLGPQLNLIFWLLTGLAFVFLVLRLYCKFHRGRKLWWDDHLLIASWVRPSVTHLQGWNTKLTDDSW